MYSSKQSKTTKPKIWRYIIWAIVIIIVLSQLISGGTTISMEGQQIIKQWDTYYGLISDLWWINRMRAKQWLRKHADDLPPLKPGIVMFSWSYSVQEWVDLIDASTGKPQTIRLTLLEWWSSYDIDARLTELWLVDAWDYHAAITDPSIINEYAQQYQYLQKQYSTTIPSLEWYLYPDTYFVDTDKDIIRQLLTMQLKAYQDKVREPYSSQILWYSQTLKSDWFTFDLTPYSLMKLASVIENEEKANANKPAIAGIFLNRIQQGMRLDADITLCYGKAVTYDVCTPAFIVQNLKDSANGYNTRVEKWLPPTPISNPSVATIKALLEYKKSWDLYYLHDSSGQIYTAATNDQHNANKVRYLN